MAGLALASDPVVSNVRAVQRLGTPYVDITYDLADAGTNALFVSVAVSTNSGVSYFTPPSGLSGQMGGVVRGADRSVVWNAGASLPPWLFNNVRVQVTATNVSSLPFSVTISSRSAFIYVNSTYTWDAIVQGGVPPYEYQWSKYGSASITTGSVFSTIFTTVGLKWNRVLVTDHAGAVCDSGTNSFLVGFGGGGGSEI